MKCDLKKQNLLNKFKFSYPIAPDLNLIKINQEKGIKRTKQLYYFFSLIFYTAKHTHFDQKHSTQKQLYASQQHFDKKAHSKYIYIYIRTINL